MSPVTLAEKVTSYLCETYSDYLNTEKPYSPAAAGKDWEQCFTALSSVFGLRRWKMPLTDSREVIAQ